VGVGVGVGGWLWVWVCVYVGMQIICSYAVHAIATASLAILQHSGISMHPIGITLTGKKFSNMERTVCL
jgi:hypothetical protein